MGVFSSTQPSLRARVLPRFPAQVLAGNGISITKSGGTYTFAVDGSQVTLNVAPLAPLTFATRPAAVAGTLAYITDSPTASMGAGVTAGGGANKVLTWFNGTAWTIIGI